MHPTIPFPLAHRLHSLTFQTAYTISKTMEEVSFLNAQDFTLASPLNSRLERRLLEWDAPQKLAVLFTYEIPFARRKAFLGGWQLNGDLTFQSGFPVPFPNAAPLAPRSASLPGDQRTRERWFDTSIFPKTGQAPFTLRNFPTRFPDVRFSALKNLDLTLFKDFQLAEKTKLNFRAECYNITNTPWFPRLDTTSVTAANFGNLNLAQTNTVRRFILALRLLW